MNCKVKMLLVKCLIATEKRNLVSMNKSNWEFIGICKKKKVLMGYAVVKSSLHLLVGKIVDIKVHYIFKTVNNVGR